MNDDDALLTIGELARASGLSISALRFYDRQGVLAPTEVNPAWLNCLTSFADNPPTHHVRWRSLTASRHQIMAK